MATETAAPESPAVEAEGPSKYQQEREAHGPVSAVQLIGNLTTDVSFEEPRNEGGVPTLRGRIAVNHAQRQTEGKDDENAEQYDQTSFLWFEIRPLKANNVPEKAVKALAKQLIKGQRVKLQGPLEIRQSLNEEVSTEDKRIYSTFPVVKCFWDGSSVPTDKSGSRPVTLLSPIGNGAGGAMAREDMPWNAGA